jgi:hypothetical protein
MSWRRGRRGCEERDRTDTSEQRTASRKQQWCDGPIEPRLGVRVATVPPLRGRRAADGAAEKTGHSGRDDKRREKANARRRQDCP